MLQFIFYPSRDITTLYVQMFINSLAHSPLPCSSLRFYLKQESISGYNELLLSIFIATYDSLNMYNLVSVVLVSGPTNSFNICCAKLVCFILN